MIPPRVGIDGFNLALRHGTGVATYARGLARAVAGFGRPADLIFGLPVPPATPPALRETLFFDALGRDEPEAAPGAGGARRWPKLWVSPRARRLVEVPVAGQVCREGFEDRLPSFSRLYSYGSLWGVAARHYRRYGRFLEVYMADPPAIMHWTYPVPVRLRGAANIYTIHDLVPLRLPHTCLENKRLHHRLLRTCLREAWRLCTVSETSRQDIITYLGADPEQVINCYQSIDPVPPIDPSDLNTRLSGLFGLAPQSYFLFVGAIEPKKNVGRLIEAYLSAGIQTPLILAGPPAWRAQEELRLLHSPATSSLAGLERIRMVGHLPRRLLDLLIAGARAVLFPSLYEGFGLPLVEAMARGVPALTSTAGSLPEVAGEAALTVDPYDVAGMAAALVRLDLDEGLRQHLSALGPRQAARFAPAAFRDALWQLYAPHLAAGDAGTPVSSHKAVMA